MMQIEIGKYYRTAEGKVHGPLRITKSHPDRFTDEQGNWYGDDGHYWQQRPGCPFSLVALAETPPPRPTVTIFVPDGYADTAEFLKDCGFELAPQFSGGTCNGGN